MRLISALPCTDYGQHCIVIYLSFIVIIKQIIAKKRLEMFRTSKWRGSRLDSIVPENWFHSIPLPSRMRYIRYSLVLHWCLDEEKCKKSCALRTQSQRCHRTCCVIKYVFILGLQYWTNWTKKKMKSTNFTRGKCHILKLEDWFRHFDYYRCTKKKFQLV